MIVRYPSTGNTGEVLDQALLSPDRVGDLSGTWYFVDWVDGLGATWVQATSVDIIHPAVHHDLWIDGLPQETQ